MSRDPETTTWWKDWSLEPGSGGRWKIGSSIIEAFHEPGEWLITRDSRPTHEIETQPWGFEGTHEAPTTGQIERFVAGADADRIALRPQLADRSVVAKPRVPLHVLPGEQTRIYVASPVWVEVIVGARGRTIIEIPAIQMSDTWFGSSTRDGEVAYSLRTFARSRLSEVPKRSFRAVTPVVLRNESDEQLELDRMNLPIPYLSVFASQKGELWTERITLTRREDREMAALEAGSGPPQEAASATRLSTPRRQRSSGLLVRAFGSLLRPFHNED